jgi:ligand-binding sensor domain-containing protein
VLSLLQTPDGALWFGTAAGLARFDGQSWQTFQAADLGLESEQINDLVYDASVSPPQLWSATQSGAAVYDGTSWTAYTSQNSGLIDDAVFALAVQPIAPGRLLWFGTLSGVASYNPQTGAWQAASANQVNPGWGGVADLLVDSNNILWVSTLGGGIDLWDGLQWSYYRPSNSDLPYSMVQDVEEFDAGVFWIATSRPNEAGGLVSRLSGEEWQDYRPIFSGYSGAETMAIARDASGRIWFGTRTDGINIFEEDK